MTNGHGIKVKKRSGAVEALNLDKIHKMVEEACEGLGSGVSASQVEMNSGLQFFDGIDVFTASVVTLVRQTLGVLVGKHRTLSLHHGTGGKVLGCDQFQVGFLALPFLIDERGDIRIRLSQISVDGASRNLAHEMSVKL